MHFPRPARHRNSSDESPWDVTMQPPVNHALPVARDRLNALSDASLRVDERAPDREPHATEPARPPRDCDLSDELLFGFRGSFV
jgi:hypothetical protein